MYGNDGSVTSVEEKKLFVGGLGWDTTERQIREYFTKYGDIESITMKTNPSTGRSRGFAFVCFNSKDALDQVVNQHEHIINGRKVDPKPAMARTGKLFVGGLRAEISDEDVKNHFSQFGTILDMEVPFDKQKNHRRGFCFVTFEQEQVVTELMKNPRQSINGYQVDLRKAAPKVDYPPGGGSLQRRPPQPYSGYGGRGGGRGGFYGAAPYGGPPHGGDGYGGYGGGPGNYNSYGSGGGAYDSYSGYDGYTGYGGGGGGYAAYNNGYSNYNRAPSYAEGGAAKRSGYARHQPY